MLVGDRVVRAGDSDRTPHVEQRLVEAIVAAGDPHSSGIDKFGVLLVAEHEIKQLDSAPGTRFADLDGERHERNRSNEFHGEAGQVEGVTGAVFSEIATGQHRRGAAVHRARVPGAGTERSGVHPHSVAFEHGVDHARTLGNSRRDR